MNPIHHDRHDFRIFTEQKQKSRWNWGFIGCVGISLFVWCIIGAIFWEILGAA